MTAVEFRAGKCLGCRKVLTVDTRIPPEDEVCFACSSAVPCRQARAAAC